MERERPPIQMRDPWLGVWTEGAPGSAHRRHCIGSLSTHAGVATMRVCTEPQPTRLAAVSLRSRSLLTRYSLGPSFTVVASESSPSITPDD